MTMFTYVFVSGLCLLLVLHIVGKLWQSAVEIHSAADNLNKGHGLAARREQAIKDRQHNASRPGWLETSPPKYCHVW
jgi:hypothetical protein